MSTTSPIIIAFASPKGGVGKSTTCLGIAGALSKQGKLVHVVDYDQTETLWNWYSTTGARDIIPNLTVEKSPPENLRQYMHRFLELKHDYVLIDLPGTLTPDMLALGVLADLTITPSKLNVPDTLQASKLAADLLDTAKRIGKPLQHRVLINDVPTMLSRAQAFTLEEIDGSNLPRFKTFIYTRPAAYTEAFLNGRPPHFSDTSRPAITKAIEELDALVSEIQSIVGQRQEERAAA
ncbi:ParA family protein [Hyphomicrobium sp.]|uniref:ParA family protein n=1 Tax=Hyphomicrobium sp. TaxID=82 RepID=UPI002E36FC59|nr:ParA family protein [Hyphomicrobium sp.]HEX2842056.1 ParA family protein [Hyphomicrobium sp.]